MIREQTRRRLPAQVASIVLGAAMVAAGEELPRSGFFGAAITTITEEARREQKLDEGVGVLVRGVLPGTTADEAGLKVGDVITSVDGTKVADPSQYVAKLGRRK